MSLGTWYCGIFVDHRSSAHHRHHHHHHHHHRAAAAAAAAADDDDDLIVAVVDNATDTVTMQVVRSNIHCVVVKL